MMKLALGITLMLSSVLLPLFAQQDRVDDEAMETLRFIRLAETKKRLNLDETKLLQLNEMLDKYESKRFTLKYRQRVLNRRIKKGFTRDEAEALLQDLRQVHNEIAENDAFLWDQAEQMLNPYEALEFFQFYSKFQNEVRRRIRALKDNRRQKDRQQPPHRNNNRNRRNHKN